MVPPAHFGGKTGSVGPAVDEADAGLVAGSAVDEDVGSVVGSAVEEVVVPPAEATMATFWRSRQPRLPGAAQ